MANGPTIEKGWMSDVQRALALILIGSFAFATLASTAHLVFSGDLLALTDMAKTLQAAMVNMSLIALGFFFGNTMSKMRQDEGTQNVVDKLTGQPPSGGPVEPKQRDPEVVVAWWSVLTDEEKAAISAESSATPRVAAFVEAAKVGKAASDDLTYLVGKGLLTQERATEIQSA